MWTVKGGREVDCSGRNQDFGRREGWGLWREGGMWIVEGGRIGIVEGGREREIVEGGR